MKITSFSNEKVKLISRLKDKKDREKNSQFVIEGYRELTRAVASKWVEFECLYFSTECFLGENEDNLIDEILKAQIPYYELPRNIFEKISYRDRPDGLIAIAKLPNKKFTLETKLTGDLFLLIEGVEKPGNLGTILRTAEGAGVSTVIVADPRIDLFNPNVIRASTGTIFTLPVFSGEIKTVMDYFGNNKIPMIAVTPEAKDYYFDTKLNGKLALVFGSEQYGLSDIAKNSANKQISIPMKGEADSLNLAMSVGIILYDVIRQRMQI